MEGIGIKPGIGIGDALQFSSVPENYFRATGVKLIDVNKPWFFDHNPYVMRDAIPTKITEMWNFSPVKFEWPRLREEGVYLSNAELYAAVLGVPVILNRPRLYVNEVYPFEKREKILLHLDGKSHGLMPAHIVKHVVEKYGPSGRLFLIGKIDPSINIGIPRIETPTLWDLANVISTAAMLIGMDSGPAWIAACYPDVVVKKLRSKPAPEYFKTWVPLAVKNIHSHWDDRCHQIFNVTEDDIGFTWSYKRI